MPTDVAVTPETPTHPLRGLTDAELAQRASGESLPAFAVLVERYDKRLRSFLRRRVRSEADLDDIVQDTFIRAWTNIARYDARWQFSTWLFTIGGRLAVSHLRKRSRQPTVSGAALDHAPATSVGDPAGAAASRETGDQLWPLAERLLSGDSLTALWLRYAEDLSIGEIARILQRSSVGVRVMLFRARERLAAHLDDGAFEDKDATETVAVLEAPLVGDRVGG